MSGARSFDVLLISASEYRIDGTFRYTATELPDAGDLIMVADEIGGPPREARVRRVDPEQAFPIHATDATPLAPERWVAPHEQTRRRSYAEARRVLNGRRGWLSRERRRRPQPSEEL
jgi:hypothetical protein